MKNGQLNTFFTDTLLNPANFAIDATLITISNEAFLMEDS
jgi:hypothetical protein